jgi:hypothetical protein
MERALAGFKSAHNDQVNAEHLAVETFRRADRLITRRTGSRRDEIPRPNQQDATPSWDVVTVVALATNLRIKDNLDPSQTNETRQTNTTETPRVPDAAFAANGAPHPQKGKHHA